MDELLNILKPEFSRLIPELLRVAVTVVIALAFVYLIGRMLGLVQSPRIKNLAAFLMILATSSFYSWNFYEFPDFPSLAWDVAVSASFAVLTYVLVGFKLYDRCDDFLDRRFGKDKPLHPKK